MTLFSNHTRIAVLADMDTGKKRLIPAEIDDHYRMYGKEPWEVEYGEKCILCDSRIDEYGFCSCGSNGE